MTAPLLVFGWGNLSRGDDALGQMPLDVTLIGPEGETLDRALSSRPGEFRHEPV